MRGWRMIAAVLFVSAFWLQPAFGQGTPANPLPVSRVTDVPSYSAAVTAQAYTVAGDVFCVNGPTATTKVVRVLQIRVSVVATAAIVGDVTVVLRSTLDTGGGLASVPVVKHDQNNAAALGSASSFTSAPTPGTSIGTVRSLKLAASTPANAAGEGLGVFTFQDAGQALVLRGATQQACVNVSAFGTGAAWDIDATFTETTL